MHVYFVYYLIHPKLCTFGFLICSYCGSNISGHCPVPQLDSTFLKLQQKLENVHFIMHFQENERIKAVCVLCQHTVCGITYISVLNK